MSKWQIQLKGKWTDYWEEENDKLMQAFMSGYPKCVCDVRGERYEYDFATLEQHNITSGKVRKIRPPYKLKRPSKAVEQLPPGRTMAVIVPDGGVPGAHMSAPHPDDAFVSVDIEIPQGAGPGATLLVPVPDLPVQRQMQAVYMPTTAANQQAMAPGAVPGGYIMTLG